MCSLCPVAAGAQIAVVASGGSAESATHKIGFSVGQIAVGSASTVDYRLNEGMQQPLTVEDVSINSADNLMQVIVSPNPTTMSVTLQREGETSPSEVCLFSIDGRMLYTEQWDGATLVMDLKSYSAGVYILQVGNKTYKITKL